MRPTIALVPGAGRASDAPAARAGGCARRPSRKTRARLRQNGAQHDDGNVALGRPRGPVISPGGATDLAQPSARQSWHCRTPDSPARAPPRQLLVRARVPGAQLRRRFRRLLPDLHQIPHGHKNAQGAGMHTTKMVSTSPRASCPSGRSRRGGLLNRPYDLAERTATRPTATSSRQAWTKSRSPRIASTTRSTTTT